MDTFPTPHASEMVERVAKAMCASVDENWDARDFGDTSDGADPENMRLYWRELARAAIEAMREPTPYMMAVTLPIGPIKVDRPTMILCERTLGLLEPEGFPAEAHAGGMDSAQRLVADWRAMVDAALSEPQP